MHCDHSHHSWTLGTPPLPPGVDLFCLGFCFSFASLVPGDVYYYNFPRITINDTTHTTGFYCVSISGSAHRHSPSTSRCVIYDQSRGQSAHQRHILAVGQVKAGPEGVIYWVTSQ